MYARLLCNLSFRPIARPAVLLPVVPLLIELSKVSDDETQSACALTLGNMSWFQSCQIFLVNNGAVNALIRMTNEGGTETKRRSVASLKNLLFHEVNKCIPCYDRLNIDVVKT